MVNCQNISPFPAVEWWPISGRREHAMKHQLKRYRIGTPIIHLSWKPGWPSTWIYFSYPLSEWRIIQTLKKKLVSAYSLCPISSPKSVALPRPLLVIVAWRHHRGSESASQEGTLGRPMQVKALKNTHKKLLNQPKTTALSPHSSYTRHYLFTDLLILWHFRHMPALQRPLAPQDGGGGWNYQQHRWHHQRPCPVLLSVGRSQTGGLPSDPALRDDPGRVPCSVPGLKIQHT